MARKLQEVYSDAHKVAKVLILVVVDSHAYQCESSENICKEEVAV